MSLGVAGLGCEDGLTHLLNLVWPNIFETSPHVVNAVMGAIDGCRLALGPPIILNYTLQVPPPHPTPPINFFLLFQGSILERACAGLACLPVLDSPLPPPPLLALLQMRCGIPH